MDRRSEGGGSGGSKRERCFGVEAFWRQLGPSERRKLLRAPVAKMAEGAQHGALAGWLVVDSLFGGCKRCHRQNRTSPRTLIAKSAALALPARPLPPPPPPHTSLLTVACLAFSLPWPPWRSAAVRAEQGEEGVRELAEALALLRQQGGRCAAYWRCPCCDTRLMDAAAFVQHVQQYHEEVQYTQEGVAVQCTKCLKDVR